MPETTNLRAYLATLEELLRTHATDEVVHHCRHILQYFPKHVDTYRLLGRALLYNARWDEASAVMRRVLAVYPDDYVAHLGLAEVYSERNKGNDAMWHLERAFEHEPNNEELIAALRDLYKRFRGAEYGKIQLTAGAIARQYGRNGLYEQAIDTLRHTLEDHSDRVDLRLLLAQMLWGADQHVEAAEVALDVLGQLPDCLEANRILTQLWLLEDRPSDAQRYINRIEALDPYAALEVATGTAAPDNAFTLPELDYRRYAERVLTADQPEWLQDIGEHGASTPFTETVKLPRRPTPSADSPAAPDERSMLSKEWLTDTDISKLKQTSSLPTAQTAAPDVDLRFDDTLDDIEPPEPTTSVAARDLRRETSSLASIFSERDATEDVPDWLADTTDEAETPLPDMDSSADPLAWLRDSGIDLDDDDVTGASTGAPAAPEASGADDEDPLGWLRDSGIDLEASDLASLTHENPIVPASEVNDDDPLAWLRDSGIEIDEAAPAPALQDPYEVADDTPIHDPAADPLGWMSAYGEDIVWNDEARSQTAAGSETPAADDSGAEWLYQNSETNGPGSGHAPAAKREADDDNFDWLQDEALFADDATGSPELPDLFAPETARDEDKIVTGMLRRLDSTVQPEEMTILENNDAVAAAPADEFDWLMDAGGPAQEPAPQEAQAADRREAMSDKDSNLNPDWLDDEQAAGDGSMPDWLNDITRPGDQPEDAPVPPNEEVPEWLAALGPTYAQPESLTPEQSDEEPPGEEAAFSWTAQLDDEDTPPASQTSDEDDDAFSWAAQLDDDDDSLAPAQANQAEDFPAWLHAEELAVSTAKEDPNPNWLSDFQSEDEAQPESELPPLESDVPEWLSALQPPEATGAPIASLDDDEEDEENELEFGWFDQVIQQEENEAAQPASTAEASTPIESEIGWLPDFGDEEALETAQDESPVGLEMPDWLNNLAETETARADAAEASDEVIDVETFEWASDLEEAEAETPAGEGLSPAATVEPLAEPETGTLSWESDFQAPAVSAVDDTPEWLKDFEMESELGAQPEEDATIVTVQPDEQPEWLAETLATQAEAAEPEPAADAISEFEFELSEEQPEAETVSETEHRPAQNAPDWLNAMVPGVDLDYTPEAGEPAEPEPVAATSDRRSERDFEWLVDIVEEETQPAPEPAAAPAARFSFSKPPAWLFSKPPAWLRSQQANVGRKGDMADWPSDSSD